jgi:hypothetical protein
MEKNMFCYYLHGSNLTHMLYYLTILRLEPVIIELERQRAPVVVISHQVNCYS